MPTIPTLTRAIPSRPAHPTRSGLTDRDHQPVKKQTQVRHSPDQYGLILRTPIQNRVSVLLVHIPRLSIRGQARLAAEVGVSRSTISRLVGGKINPSFRLARGVTSALERMLGRPLDMRDVFTTDGTYPTASGCALCRCNGCLPEEAYDREGDLRPEWRDARPGDWSLAPELETCLPTHQP